MLFKLKETYSIADLKLIVAILRSEDGCPWDRVQTHQTIRKNFIEETYEAIEAIDNNDAVLLQEELGDVLLQIMLHSQIEDESGVFSFDDVTNDICHKLVTRHPHVFSNAIATDIDQVLTNWNAIKAEQKGQTKATDAMFAVPKQLPALMRTTKVQERAQKGGVVLKTATVAIQSLKTAADELAHAIEAGDQANVAKFIGEILLETVSVSREQKLDAEEILYHACDQFIEMVAKAENAMDVAETL